MELYHEYQNRYIRGIINAMNRAVDAGGISTYEFEEIVYQSANDPEHRIGRAFLDAFMESAIFDHSEKYMLKPIIPVKIGLCPTNAEYQWLYHALQSPAAALFLGESDLALLKNALEEMHLPDNMRHIESYGNAEPEMPDQALFQTVLQAIRFHRYIRMTNTAQNGIVYADQTVIPLKIEYDIATGKWYLSFCEADAGRPIRAYLNALSDVALGDIIPEEKRPDLRKLMQSKKAEPVILRISPEKNTPERAIRFFSQYNTAALPEPDGGLRMEIQYYTFDEDTLLRQILSFGPLVQVLAPERMVARVCDFLRNYPYGTG